MATEILYYLPFFLAIAFFLIGRTYKDYLFGFLSGVVFFVWGVAIFIVPLPVLTDLTNTLLALVCWATGLYIMFRAAYEFIKGD